MTIEKYHSIRTDTEKAARYLLKKGVAYNTVSVPSGCGEFHFIRWTVAGASAAAQAHVKKAYPEAIIVFSDPATVESMEAEKETAFYRCIAAKRGC